ncbi:MAG: hypothetical protein IEMM0008_1393 [bacterium]|nr:MAG: hypothetical protein IEMM0008_1393 [bacterium]
MKEKALTAKDIQNLTPQELEDFLYATDKEIYEPFFDLSGSGDLTTEIVGKITLSNDCRLNCHYCSYRKDNPVNTFTFTQSELALLCERASQLPISGLILEAGVPHPQGFNALYDLIRFVTSQFPLQVYLDIGFETLLAYPESLKASNHFFIDYSPTNESFRSTLNSFDKRNELWGLMESSAGATFYANYIVDLPGQDFKDMVDDLLNLVQSPVHGIKISPFIPQKETPFSLFGEACLLTTFKVISLTRILKPEWDIFIEPSILQLEYEDTMKKALDKGANKAVLDVSLDDTEKEWKNHDLLRLKHGNNIKLRD